MHPYAVPIVVSAASSSRSLSCRHDDVHLHAQYATDVCLPWRSRCKAAGAVSRVVVNGIHIVSVDRFNGRVKWELH